MHELILASGSPRRRELLEREGIACRVVVSDVAEQPTPDESPVEYCRRLAQDKARAVLVKLDPNPVRVLAADTIVVADDHLLEKPTDAEDAARMLRLLSGREHQVTTAVCLLTRAGEEFETDLRHATTAVRFRPLSEREIHEYIATGEPFDKAGAYGIQGGAAAFVAAIDGDYDNVVGLPVQLVKQMLG